MQEFFFIRICVLSGKRSERFAHFTGGSLLVDIRRIWEYTNSHVIQELITGWRTSNEIQDLPMQKMSLFSVDFGHHQRRALYADDYKLIYDMDTKDMWFQQDAATWHIAHATLDILNE